MKTFSHRTSNSSGRRLAAGAIGIGALVLANHFVARLAERRHPPKGAFVQVDGVRLHYTDRGEGSPVVLIHGNMVAGDDYDMSGVAGILQQRHRVIIFDRPGFGHSDRPRKRIWTVSEQADLIHAALRRIGVERPILVGHSWGAIVAMAMAVRHQADTAGVVAISGYYFWTLRPDVVLAGIGALPVVGDILRYTISPALNWLLMPVFKRTVFAPGSIAQRFAAEYSTAMAVRPSQLRAVAEDGALMIPGVLALQDRYRELALPVVIMAGEGDQVVFKRRAERLAAAIEGSTLCIIPGGGHMVHHQVPQEVAEAVEAVHRRSSRTDHPEAALSAEKVAEREVA